MANEQLKQVSQKWEKEIEQQAEKVEAMYKDYQANSIFYTEEQKIKSYKNNIDVLTLSATPIPRTLQMSLAGVRSLSLIETPLKFEGLNIGGSIKTRTALNMIEEAEKYISKREMYDITGIQFMELNTVFQLLSLKENRPYILDEAETMLFTPDLLNYMLTGIKSTEFSIATTSQMVDLKTYLTFLRE